MAKISSSHTTYIDQARMFLKFLHKLPNISKVSLGIIKIKTKKSKTSGRSKVKIVGNHILLSVSSKSAVQEIRIYGQDLESIMKSIKEYSDI